MDIRRGERVTHKDFVRLYAEKMKCTEKNAEKYLQGFVDLVHESVENKSSVTIPHLGNFYVSERSESTAFKFNPARRLKNILGWGWVYKMPLAIGFPYIL